MNATRFGLVVLLLVLPTSLRAEDWFDESKIWMLLAWESNRLSGPGTADNTFESGQGGAAEMGVTIPGSWCFVFYGTEWYQARNRVGNDSQEAVFYVPYYTELRRYLVLDRFLPFISVGYAWSRMHFEETNGWDNHSHLLLGAGIALRLHPNIALQAMYKSYRVWKNSLGQTWGRNIHLGLGFML